MISFKEFNTTFGLYEGTHVPLEQPMNMSSAGTKSLPFQPQM